MNLSPTKFRSALSRFQDFHELESGNRLESFADRSNYLQTEEGYKTILPELARRELELPTWKKSLIGSGYIVRRVIAAIEIKGNNLLYWQGRSGPQSRIHINLIEAEQDSERLKQIEGLLFSLFKEGRDTEEVFEGIMEHCGRKYSLLAYLFFIAKPNKYLPIGTTTFDSVFELLGIDLKTSGRCSWDNYNDFLAAVTSVQQSLHDEGFLEATLLDAHSFCWVLARVRFEDEISPQILAPGSFTGAFKEAAPRDDFSPNKSGKEIDFIPINERKRANGRIAEEIALESEKQRLIVAGSLNLAKKVEDVSAQIGLGYDIRSYEADGTTRHIEVKNITNGNQFYLSENEWLHSQHLDNYWFYLVDESGPTTQQVKATELNPSHLCPVQYRVNFRS